MRVLMRNMSSSYTCRPPVPDESTLGGGRGQLRHLLADTVVAMALVVAHAIIIMCQVPAVRALTTLQRSHR